jgi:ferredoxin/flavodoxin---NADP+ reductase
MSSPDLAAETAPAAYVPTANGPTLETVLSVEHFTDRLFAFRTTRPASFRFRSGEFVMIGLPVAGKPLLRAYSIACPEWDETLGFYSIKVPDGPLTSRLQLIAPGDQVLLGRKTVGTLVLDALTGGRTLWLLSTGTGIAPFASIIRTPETYSRFERVVLVHSCREAAELKYGQALVADAKADPLVGDEATAQLSHITSVTREAWPLTERITTMIDNGSLFAAAGLDQAAFDPAHDRVMICGSLDMLTDLKARCVAAGLEEGSNSAPGAFVIEKSFVD